MDPPIRTCHVYACPIPPGLCGYAVTGSAGSYAITVPNGDYRVQFGRTSRGDTPDGYYSTHGFVRNASEATLVLVRGNHITGISVQLPDDLPPPTPTATGTPASQNLLTNPSFENGQTAPSGWATDSWVNGPSFIWDGQIFHSRAKSARIIITDRPNDTRWIQTVSVAPRTDYLLSGWIKTENVSHSTELPGWDVGANISLLDWQGPHIWTRSTNLKGTNDWTFVSVSFNSADKSTVTVAARLGYFSSTVTGTAWFDDLSLTQK